MLIAQGKLWLKRGAAGWYTVLKGGLRMWLCVALSVYLIAVAVYRARATADRGTIWRILGYELCVCVVLTALGAYEPVVSWGGAGATVPLLGFGYTLANGVREAAADRGWLGVLTGGLAAAAGGITAAIAGALLAAALFRPGDKRK